MRQSWYENSKSNWSCKTTSTMLSITAAHQIYKYRNKYETNEDDESQIVMLDGTPG